MSQTPRSKRKGNGRYTAHNPKNKEVFGIIKKNNMDILTLDEIMSNILRETKVVKSCEMQKTNAC